MTTGTPAQPVAPLIGIVAAYRAEIAPLLHRAQSVRRAAQGDFRLTLPQGEAVLVIAGAGRSNARAAAELLISRYPLRCLVSIGFAGGLAPGLDTGKLLVATRVVDAVSGASHTCAADFFPAGTGQAGDLLTVSSVVAKCAEKSELHARWSAAAADMEASAVAEVAEAAAISFAAMKAITDGPTDELAIDFQRCLTSNGGLSSGKIIIEGLRGIAQFRSLLLLARNSQAAASSLAKALSGAMSR